MRRNGTTVWPEQHSSDCCVTTLFYYSQVTTFALAAIDDTDFNPKCWGTVDCGRVNNSHEIVASTPVQYVYDCLNALQVRTVTNSLGSSSSLGHVPKLNMVKSETRTATRGQNKNIDPIQHVDRRPLLLQLDYCAHKQEKCRRIEDRRPLLQLDYCAHKQEKCRRIEGTLPYHETLPYS